MQQDKKLDKLNVFHLISGMPFIQLDYKSLANTICDVSLIAI